MAISRIVRGQARRPHAYYDTSTQGESPEVVAVGPDGGAVPVTLAADTDGNAGEYETVAASQTDQALGATGAAGDYLMGLLVVPANTSPGAVSIKDGGGSSVTVFTGGATSVSSLVPFFIPLGVRSLSGAWKITTGASVSAIAVGDFT